MSATFTETEIKLEEDPAENVTEIQSYLEGFQKEIEGADGTVQQMTGNKPTGFIQLNKFNYLYITI